MQETGRSKKGESNGKNDCRDKGGIKKRKKEDRKERNRIAGGQS